LCSLGSVGLKKVTEIALIVIYIPTPIHKPQTTPPPKTTTQESFVKAMISMD
jgi:hypothetical protein